MQQRWEKFSPRQIRQLDFISQFTSDIQHISGKDNVVADTLSRVEAITLPSTIDFEDLADEQTNDQELKNLVGKNSTSLQIKRIQLPDCNKTLLCDVSHEKVRPYVPKTYRKKIFESLHNLSHSGIRASVKLIASRFVWPRMNSEVRDLAKCCILCQRNKEHKHTKSNLKLFSVPDQRFEHVNLDIFGPLPTSNGYTY